MRPPHRAWRPSAYRARRWLLTHELCACLALGAGFFAWNVSTNGTVYDHLPAPDAEAYIVTALIAADRKWYASRPLDGSSALSRLKLSSRVAMLGMTWHGAGRVSLRTPPSTSTAPPTESRPCRCWSSWATLTRGWSRRMGRSVDSPTRVNLADAPLLLDRLEPQCRDAMRASRCLTVFEAWAARRLKQLVPLMTLMYPR